MEDNQALRQEGGTADMKTDMSSQLAQESLLLDSSDMDYSHSTWQTTEQPSTTFVGRKDYPMLMLRAGKATNSA